MPDENEGLRRAPALDRGLRWLGHQRWLRYGVRDRLLRLLRHPERVDDRAFEVPFAGFVYPGQMNRWIDWIVYYYGAYELDELELLRTLLTHRPEAVALDIGANVGHHALYLASFCAEVHAFEPYETVSRCLDEKVRRNRLAHIHLHRVGLGERDEELDFFAPQGANTGTGTFVAGHETQNNRLAGRLRLVRADDYLARLRLSTVDLIKIDVEGFELSVLRGLRATLGRYRPMVMMELSDQARIELTNHAEFMALFPPGYVANVVRSQRNRLVLLGERGCALEALHWDCEPTPGGYINLLLRPNEQHVVPAALTSAAQ